MTDALPDSLQVGDIVPGHVAILEGRDAAGSVHVHDARALDEPFIGFFFPCNLYPEWRCRLETVEAWQAEIDAGALPLLRRA